MSKMALTPPFKLRIGVKIIVKGRHVHFNPLIQNTLNVSKYWNSYSYVMLLFSTSLKNFNEWFFSVHKDVVTVDDDDNWKPFLNY